LKIAITGKKIGSGIVNTIGVNDRLLKGKYRGRIVILTYHRVLNKEDVEDYIQSGMYVETGTFREHLLYIKKYFKIIPISDIPLLIGESDRKAGDYDRPFIALTFDDGWSDFYKNAYPLIEKENLHATVFLPTGFIDSKQIFWTDTLGYIINKRRNNSQLPLAKNVIVRNIEELGGNKRIVTENAIRILKNLPEEEIRDVIRTLSDRWNIPCNPSERLFLTWDEVRDMHGSGHVMIGSHSENHHVLTKLKEERVLPELLNSKEKLLEKQVVDNRFIPFSYPNGDYNERIVEMVRRAGYGVAVTTTNGWNVTAAGTDLFRLKRISIHQDMTATESMFSSRILNII
jgi:peptidoglycan/xylan/chitin deacetylase (PgdA/CDA1 family)